MTKMTKMSSSVLAFFYTGGRRLDEMGEILQRMANLSLHGQGFGFSLYDVPGSGSRCNKSTPSAAFC
jgi:hypothetical protein